MTTGVRCGPVVAASSRLPAADPSRREPLLTSTVTAPLGGRDRTYDACRRPWKKEQMDVSGRVHTLGSSSIANLAVFSVFLVVSGLSALETPSVATAWQGSDLRIVVLEGEDNVNIIGQGTAVPTVVEVRDRNDLPVSGASVLFLLGEGGTATLKRRAVAGGGDDERAGAGCRGGEPAGERGSTAPGQRGVSGTDGDGGHCADERGHGNRDRRSGRWRGRNRGRGRWNRGWRGRRDGSGGRRRCGRRAGDRRRCRHRRGERGSGGGRCDGGARRGPRTFGGGVADFAERARDGRADGVPLRRQRLVGSERRTSLTYSWDFGDGGRGSGVTATHIYAAAGTCEVTLTVNDGSAEATSKR